MDKESTLDGVEQASISEQGRLLEQALEGLDVVDLADAIKEKEWNGGQEAAELQMLESLKGCYVELAPEVADSARKISKEGYKIALVGTDGSCRVAGYPELARTLSCKTDELTAFLKEAGYTYPPSVLGQRGGLQKNPARFLEAVYS